MAKKLRPPVIAVMGHIDHGKSSLLDYIRKTNVVAGESGGITQHVAAYTAVHNGRPITFLDTPGHEAFKALRTRGAAAADIAILVVAADEGVKPQTLDALTAIKEAGIPYIVAITKIDKNNADVERTKISLLENEIFLESQGGDVPFAPISSKTGEGIPELLDLVFLVADVAELEADFDTSATGFVLESTQDAKRGTSATVIIKDGTLTTSGFLVAGDAYAPIRFIENFLGKRITHAEPSEPVHISGFNKLPAAGTLFSIVQTKKEAESLTTENSSIATMTRAAIDEDNIMLPLIIKADVGGSLEAIKHELAKHSHERVALNIVSESVGTVSETDVKTARAVGGTIIAFNVATDTVARDLAEREGIAIESFSIIYELTERVAELAAKRAPIRSAEEELGRALVLKTFSSGAKKQVLGARHLLGTFTVGNRVKILRRDIEITRGSIANLQQARSDTKEIKTEGEFGIEIQAKEDTAPGDEIVAFTVVEK